MLKMKKHPILLGLLLGLQFGANAQIEAYTSNGDTVLLFDDGKWDYKNNLTEASIESHIDTLPALNPEKFYKPKSAKAVAKGRNAAYEIAYAASKWDREIKKLQSGTDMEFHYKNSEGFILTIYESVELPMATLRNIALSNARGVSSDFEILEQEMRTVNDQPMLYMRFNATIQGIKFAYMGYYASFPEGSLQVLAFSYLDIFDSLKPAFQDFLNGIIVKE